MTLQVSETYVSTISVTESRNFELCQKWYANNSISETIDKSLNIPYHVLIRLLSLQIIILLISRIQRNEMSSISLENNYHQGHTLTVKRFIVFQKHVFMIIFLSQSQIILSISLGLPLHLT